MLVVVGFGVSLFVGLSVFISFVELCDGEVFGGEVVCYICCLFVCMLVNL